MWGNPNLSLKDQTSVLQGGKKGKKGGGGGEGVWAALIKMFQLDEVVRPRSFSCLPSWLFLASKLLNGRFLWPLLVCQLSCCIGRQFVNPAGKKKWWGSSKMEEEHKYFIISVTSWSFPQVSRARLEECVQCPFWPLGATKADTLAL